MAGDAVLRTRNLPKLCSHDSVRSTYQRYFPSPLPCGVRRRAIRGRMPRRATFGDAGRSRSPGRRTGCRGRRRGRPGLPRTGGIASTSGIIGLTSGTLAAGRLRHQRDPARVGDHVVLAPLLAAVHRAGAGLLAPAARPHEAAVDQGPRPVDLVRRRAARPGATRGASARRRPRSSRAAAASRSCRSRSPSPGAGPPRGCRS